MWKGHPWSSRPTRPYLTPVDPRTQPTRSQTRRTVPGPRVSGPLLSPVQAEHVTPRPSFETIPPSHPVSHGSVVPLVTSVPPDGNRSLLTSHPTPKQRPGTPTRLPSFGVVLSFRPSTSPPNPSSAVRTHPPLTTRVPGRTRRGTTEILPSFDPVTSPRTPRSEAGLDDDHHLTPVLLFLDVRVRGRCQR